MRLALANDQLNVLREALRRAGRREIGGQLFGEQLAPSVFRVTHLTVQRSPGTVSRFVVDVAQVALDALAFFQRTRRDYRRFNYLGEWHSHPSFDVYPSGTDQATMRSLVTDRDFRGQFALLMIARLDCDNVTLGTWLFDPSGGEVAVPLEHPE